MNDPVTCNVPQSELLIEACWNPPCENIAAFRDGAGWWCIRHKDNAMWGIDRVQNRNDICRKINKLFEEK